MPQTDHAPIVFSAPRATISSTIGEAQPDVGEQRIEQAPFEFSVYIIESPSPKDLFFKNYEGEMLSKALSLASISCTHRLAANSEAFFAALHVDLGEYLKQPGAHKPILHISAHGNSDGIQLTNGETIDWDSLQELVAPINAAMQDNLIICMSSCEGFTACGMAMTVDGEPPYLALVGNIEKPTWSDAAIGFAAFYHLLAKGESFRRAVAGMKAASGNDGFMYILGKQAKELFLERWQQLEVGDVQHELEQAAPPSDSSLAKASKEDSPAGVPDNDG